MLESVLPDEIISALKKLNEKNIYEIRIRDGKTVKVNYSGRYISLTYNNKPIVSDIGTCARIMTKACDFSLYSINNQIIQGFVSAEHGARIGLCGEIVRENDGIKTVKNFNSLNIRIPHDVAGCAGEIFRYVFAGRSVCNSLIVSPPGKGKTTMLRDLSRKLSEANLNVLIVDERNEICAVNAGKPYYDIGENCDVITFGGKDFALSYGIRTMAPDVIVTDELMSAQDAAAVSLAMAGGVSVIASVHADGIEELKSKSYLKELFAAGTVEKYIVLSSEEIGKLKGVYDRDFRRVK